MDCRGWIGFGSSLNSVEREKSCSVSLRPHTRVPWEPVSECVTNSRFEFTAADGNREDDGVVATVTSKHARTRVVPGATQYLKPMFDPVLDCLSGKLSQILAGLCPGHDSTIDPPLQIG